MGIPHNILRFLVVDLNFSWMDFFKAFGPPYAFIPIAPLSSPSSLLINHSIALLCSYLRTILLLTRNISLLYLLALTPLKR